MINLRIIVASTRPGRKGPAIASWIYKLCTANPLLNTAILDLSEINLPFLDETKHPRFQEYANQHTKNWSKEIENSDAFIIVTPEYNHSFPAPLKNALDFLYWEWNYKPIAFVSYGGVAGGARAVQQLTPVTTALNMMPLSESVCIPSFTKYIDDSGNFNAENGLILSAEAMLAALTKWAEILPGMRRKKNSIP